ncbi:MAG: hypothetical protein P1V51_14075 [Deltaproteobacteria bacterium]|nr:hypothetical protein [Deltaproteobacteria bacterium]
MPASAALRTLPFLAAALLLGACPKRVPVPPAPPPVRVSPESELEALLATDRALRREQGEQLWGLWVRGEPGGVSESYERYPALSSRATFERLAALRPLLPGREESTRALQRSVAGNLLARTTAEVDGRIAHLQATATLELDGAPLPWRELGPRLARESDARRREQLRQSAAAVQARHLLLLEERRGQAEQAAAALGLSPLELRDLLLPAPAGELVALARALLDQDEEQRLEALGELARGRTGAALAELPESDLGRLFAPEPGEEALLPASRLLDDLELLLPEGGSLAAAASTLAAGEDGRQAPLPLCLPVAPPADLRLALSPQAGLRARLDSLREAVICAELAAVPQAPGGAADPLPAQLEASARAHQALHRALAALESGERSLPGLPEAQARTLARREAARLRAGARREAALLLSVLTAPEGAALAHHGNLMQRALGLSPAPEPALAWERAWAEAHLPALAARVLATARAHDLPAGLAVRPEAPARPGSGSPFDTHGSLKE